MMLGHSKQTRNYTQNRELSWLKFNERIIEEADDRSVPLIERLKFLSIFTSNLDEFFMIRVGSLFDISHVAPKSIDNKSGMSPDEQLDAIYKAVAPLYQKKNLAYNKIRDGLRNYGVYALEIDELETNEIAFIKEYYKTNIEPILSPQIVDTHHPFPHIRTKEIYIMTMLKHKNAEILGLLPIPPSLPEIVYLPGSDVRFVRIENILYNYCDKVFGHYEIKEKNCICITRNADISTDDEAFDDIVDFRTHMKKMLHKRNRLAVVRLEANYHMTPGFTQQMCEKFKIQPKHIFITKTALKMGYVFGIESKLSSAQHKQLIYPPFKPAPSPDVDLKHSILKQVRNKDVLLHYPYQSMDVFLQMIKESAYEKSVISIKITIYRLAKKAKLVEYLCAAAENGKEVTVLMELRARFDEQNNIDWSERLEDAGCKIIYGFGEFKTHSKVCLITMKDKADQVQYITQIGTGNYNEKTAELYTDLALITANKNIGTDVVEFFKCMSISSTSDNYNHLLVAPEGLKPKLLKLIDDEIEKGSKGKISFKVNSFTDIDFIDKLAEASKAGVRVLLIVRGICCLVPGITGETENIQAMSIVNRFLEHSRIYSFGEGDEQKIYISSADLMTRNTGRRIEVACPIFDKNIIENICMIMNIVERDNVKARCLNYDGSYYKCDNDKESFDSQKYFLKHYSDISIQEISQQKNKKSLLKKFKDKFFRK